MENGLLAAKFRLQELIYAYWVERNIPKVLSLLTDDIHSIGLGAYGFAGNKLELKKLLENECKHAPKALAVDFDEMMYQPISSDCIALFSRITVKQKASNGLLPKRMDLTAFLRFQKNEYQVCTLHLSLKPEKEEKQGLCCHQGEEKLPYLKENEEGFALHKDTVSFGMVSRFNQPGYPVYFLHHQFLRHLGYNTYEEFLHIVEGCVANSIHPEDRDRVQHTLHTSFHASDEYHLQYRMLKKEGDYVWVWEQGKKFFSASGKPFILGLCMTPVLSHQHALWSQEKDNIWQKKRLRIALSQMAIGLFDFSLSTHTIVQWDNFLAIEPLSQRIETTPEMLVKNGLVHREDAQFFLALFERIEQDETVVSCAIRTKILSANYAWNKITLVAVDNEKGIPYHAVGVVEDITKQKEIELCCGQKEQYWNMMLAEAAVYYEVNVTEDLVETYREKEALGWQEIPKESYHQLLTDIVETRVFAQDKEKYVKTFGIASIMQSFAEGIHELRLEHCWHDKQGQKVWMLTTMHIIRDVLTGNIKGFTYIKNIDEQKQRILALQYQSQRDSLTGLYNRKVTEGLIQDILKRENKPQCHGFLIIDVDDFKQINDTYGHRFGDQILAEIAQKISRLFHQHDVFGRIGGDEFAVFIYNAASPDYVKEKVLAVQQLFLKPFFQKNWPLQISCSMGIAMVGKDGNTFEELYEHADIALYEAKKQGKNCYVFYGSDMKNTLRALHQCAKINWDS